MSFEKEIREFGEQAEEAPTKELTQLHMRDTFAPRFRDSLTEEEWKRACETVNSTKEKKDGVLKGGTCADRRKQRDCINKEDSASPAVSTEEVSLTGVMEAKQEQKAIALDTWNTFIQTHSEDVSERAILFLRGLACQ